MKTKRLLTILLLATLTVAICLLAGCGCKHENATYTPIDEYGHKVTCADCDKALGASEPHTWEGTYCSLCNYGSQYTQGLEYELSSNEAYYSVTGKGSFTGGVLNISPMYEGLPVERIASKAFVQNYTITEAIIPSTINYIGEMALDNCVLMTKVTFAPDTQLNTIGVLAFAYNPNLMEITIPSTVTDVKERAFEVCQALTIYCESTKSAANSWHSSWNVGNNPVVWDCNNNDKATDGNVYVVHQGVRYSISNGQAAVAVQTQGITKAHIVAKLPYKGSNYNVTSIVSSAFREEPQGDPWHLAEITFDDTCQISKIGEMAFENCIELAAITLPSTVTTLGMSTFRHCWILESVTIPAQVTTIPDHCFWACLALEEITIPSGVTKIGTAVFYQCQALQKVNFVNSNDWSITGISGSTQASETIKLLQSQVSDSTLMAQYFTVTYPGYTWKRG